MGIWADRISLARDHWSSELRLEARGAPDGHRKIGLWARTYFWSGGISEVCFHVHDLIGTNAPDLAARIDALGSRLLEQCRRGREEYIGRVPCQLPDLFEDGRQKLAEHSRETEYLNGRGQNAAPPPHDGSLDVEAAEAGVYCGALAGLLGQDLHYGDRIDQHGDGLLLRNPAPRIWRHRAEPTFTTRNGIRLKFQPTSFENRDFSEVAMASHVTASVARLGRLMDEYAPSGSKHGQTGNGLPPGYQTLAEYRAEAEARLVNARLDDDGLPTPG
ncbi:hypothetical protein ACEUZ9_004053 [Paracoccus litorisediminis]|uniref:hypothetical protein n=1 Tax=Paracoccus litorisediminis TaxID=2006130 RepID=UPI003732BD21